MEEEEEEEEEEVSETEMSNRLPLNLSTCEVVSCCLYPDTTHVWLFDVLTEVEQTSELEIRLATAKKLMKDQKVVDVTGSSYFASFLTPLFSRNDWVDAGYCVEKIRSDMERTNLDKLDYASKKLSSTQVRDEMQRV
eukprot:398253-Hanusia_phi.AAC.1